MKRITVILLALSLVLLACTPRVITLEGETIELRTAFNIKLQGSTYPVYEFEHDGLYCLISYGSFLSGLWCERIEE